MQASGRWTVEGFIELVKSFLADPRGDGLTLDLLLNSAEPGWVEVLNWRAESGEAGLEELWAPEEASRDDARKASDSAG